MKELSEGIREVIDEPIIDVRKHLIETAKKWACYVIENNCDEALRKGLDISRSLSDYVNEINECG